MLRSNISVKEKDLRRRPQRDIVGVMQRRFQRINGN